MVFDVQVKFSEMTIDMFRMMQTLEREKNRDEINHVSDPPSRASFVSSNTPNDFLKLNRYIFKQYPRKKIIITRVSKSNNFGWKKKEHEYIATISH